MIDLGEYPNWARSHYAMLAEGGIWGVPRSGLVYRKQDGKLVLFERMPHDPAMPVTAEELRQQQDSEHLGITEVFGIIGVEVVESIT